MPQDDQQKDGKQQVQVNVDPDTATDEQRSLLEKYKGNVLEKEAA